MAGRFEVFEDKAGKFRFRLKAKNGLIVASGEAYETRAAAHRGCESVMKATGIPDRSITASAARKTGAMDGLADLLSRADDDIAEIRDV